MINTHDHKPAHVHVFNADGQTIINLGDQKTRPWVRQNRGMRHHDLGKALKIVSDHQEFLLKKWRDIHG